LSGSVPPGPVSSRRAYPLSLSRLWFFVIPSDSAAGVVPVAFRSGGGAFWCGGGAVGVFQVRFGVVVVCFGVVVVLSSLPAPFSLFQEVVCAGDGFGRW
jgi:hypothetical protein